MLFSNLLNVKNSKFIIIKDEIGTLSMEKTFDKYVNMWLKEQGNPDAVLNLHAVMALSIHDLRKELERPQFSEAVKIILPSLSTLLEMSNPRAVIQFVHYLIKNKFINQVFFLCSTHILSREFYFCVVFLEYMSNIVVTFFKEKQLCVLSRQHSGGVSRKSYSFNIIENKMIVTHIPVVENKNLETRIPDHPFKIELEEEEMLARNSIKLPYEKTADSDIIYNADSDDDFDEEDPDEDLNI